METQIRVCNVFEHTDMVAWRRTSCDDVRKCGLHNASATSGKAKRQGQEYGARNSGRRGRERKREHRDDAS